MMRIYLLVVIFSSFIPTLAFSQKLYKPGLIVAQNGDTLKGFVSYNNSETNPRKIFFKSDTVGSPKVFNPENSSFFKIFTADRITEYVSYKGIITNNIINLNQLQVGRDTSILVDTIFLKTIEIGKYITLYSYTDNVKTRFFISYKGSKPQELIYRIYYDSEETDNGNRTVDEDTWKKQLYQVAEKNNVLNKKLSSLIETSDYQEEQIVNIVNNINGLTNAEVLKNNRSRLRPGYVVLIVVGGLLFLIEAIHEFSLAKS